jgi:hypothetical protein
VCSAQGKSFACINSASENADALRSIETQNGNAWFGATDTTSEGTWKCDGVAVAYTNWANDNGGDKDCAMLLTSGLPWPLGLPPFLHHLIGMWAADKCEGKRKCLCSST